MHLPVAMDAVKFDQLVVHYIPCCFLQFPHEIELVELSDAFIGKPSGWREPVVLPLKVGPVVQMVIWWEGRMPVYFLVLLELLVLPLPNFLFYSPCNSE